MLGVGTRPESLQAGHADVGALRAQRARILLVEGGFGLPCTGLRNIS